MAWLRYGRKKSEDMFSHVDRIYRRVTDRQTDAQTDRHLSTA